MTQSCFVVSLSFLFSSLEEYKQWHIWLKGLKMDFTVICVHTHTHTHTHTDKRSQGCILYINTNNKDLSRCKANTEWGIMTGLRQIIYEWGCNWTLQILQLWVMDEQERAFASVLHMLLSLALHKLYRFIPAYLHRTTKYTGNSRVTDVTSVAKMGYLTSQRKN